MTNKLFKPQNTLSEHNLLLQKKINVLQKQLDEVLELAQRAINNYEEAKRLSFWSGFFTCMFLIFTIIFLISIIF
jgi:hypothetical protein